MPALTPSHKSARTTWFLRSDQQQFLLRLVEWQSSPVGLQWSGDHSVKQHLLDQLSVACTQAVRRFIPRDRRVDLEQRSIKGTQLGLTVELRSAACHEELDGLNLGQVTVLVLLLGVAVRPVVKQEQALILPRWWTQGAITHIMHDWPLPGAAASPFICQGDIWLFQITQAWKTQVSHASAVPACNHSDKHSQNKRRTLRTQHTAQRHCVQAGWRNTYQRRRSHSPWRSTSRDLWREPRPHWRRAKGKNSNTFSFCLFF